METSGFKYKNVSKTSDNGRMPVLVGQGVGANNGASAAGSSNSTVLLSMENEWLSAQTFKEPVTFENTINFKNWQFTEDANGHLIMTGPTDKNLHLSGGIVAFSTLSPPNASWWSAMPIATDEILGAVKIGANLTVDDNGFLNAQAGTGGGADWGNIGGTLSDQSDVWTEITGKASQSWVTSQNYLTTESDTLNNVLYRSNDLSYSLNYTPSTGNIIQLSNGKPVIKRNSSNGALRFGADDSIIIGAGEAGNSIESNIVLSDEAVYIGGESGVKFYAFPNNDVNWSNRKEMIFANTGGLSVPGTITAPTFSGSLSGNASSANYATSAGSASLSAQVTVTNHTTNNTEYPLVWHNNSSTLYDSVDRLTFNPSTGQITSRLAVLSRSTTTLEAATRYQTSGYGYDWFVGMDNNTLDFSFYSYGTGSAIFSMNKTTGASTFSKDVFIGASSAILKTRHIDGMSSVNTNDDDLYLQWNKTNKSVYVAGDTNNTGAIGIHCNTTMSGEKLSIGRAGGKPSIKANTQYGDGYMMIESGGIGHFLGLNYYSDDDVRLCNGGGNVAIGATTATEKLHVYGNILATGNIFSTSEVTAYSTSDKYLKTEVKNISDPFKILNQYRPVTFKWNDRARELNSSKDYRNNFGLIAQEVEKVTPELVHPIFSSYKSVDYTPIISILIAGMQEQQKEIEHLKKMING